MVWQHKNCLPVSGLDKNEHFYKVLRISFVAIWLLPLSLTHCVKETFLCGPSHQNQQVALSQDILLTSEQFFLSLLSNSATSVPLTSWFINLSYIAEYYGSTSLPRIKYLLIIHWVAINTFPKNKTLKYLNHQTASTKFAKSLKKYLICCRQVCLFPINVKRSVLFIYMFVTNF